MEQKAAEQLEKLNRDCNMTAGLEAKLSLAVGARVMLRRNIDTKTGLVNGALGTVLSIAVNHVTVQFDHISEPYNVEMVKSRFMVMKNFYVYRKQFPLILAYAVTIHKCQGLSLDCAIIDLSEEVFSAGMAYVALSRVRSLSGLYLAAFNPRSIMVSPSCLDEVNRLRNTFRKDLPLYALPLKPRTNTKRKLTGATQHDQPKAKKGKGNSDTRRKAASKKRKRCVSSDEKTQLRKYVVAVIMSLGRNETPFRYHPVDEQWQRNACAIMGLQFRGPNRVHPGGPDVALKRPDARTIKHIPGDGNCLFRSFSYIITGSEDQHVAVRAAILNHMVNNIAHFLLGFHIVDYSSIQAYIRAKDMDTVGAWGTEIEILALAHLLQTPVLSYSTELAGWSRYSPHDVDRTLNDDDTQMSMYLWHPPIHFEVVRSIRK